MTGRRRLNSLDLVPEHARDDILWALGELNQRDRTQADILAELNGRLATKGVDPISSSAFSRASLRRRKRALQLSERKAIYAGLAEQLSPEEIGRSDIILGEFLKTLIDELLDDADLSSKQALELARAYSATVSAQRASAEHQRRTEAAAMERLVKVADAAIEKVDAVKGLSPETKEAFKRELFGVRNG
jgi:ATP-dependent exoDNAse (exonuclease V) alpha subunit